MAPSRTHDRRPKENINLADDSASIVNSIDDLAKVVAESDDLPSTTLDVPKCALRVLNARGRRRALEARELLSTLRPRICRQLEDTGDVLVWDTPQTLGDGLPEGERLQVLQQFLGSSGEQALWRSGWIMEQDSLGTQRSARLPRKEDA